MNCRFCGELSVPDTNFCRKCGARLVSHDAELTSAITKKMIKDEVAFPASGSQVVAPDNVGEGPVQKQSSDFLLTIPSYRLPEESLPFTTKPSFFTKFAAEAFEARGLFRLKMSRIRKGSGFVLKEGQEFVPDKKIKCKHIELMFVQQDAYAGEWRDPKSMIKFEDIESVEIKKRALRPKLIIRLKPEKSVSSVHVDPIIREIVLNITRKDLSLAKKLVSAIMTELSQEKLQHLLKHG